MGEKEAFSNVCFDSMLPLDMLAEVASETLKSDPTLSFQRKKENRSFQNNVGKCVQKRSATNSEILNLDQIRLLSDKMLIEMFSEHSSDEIRKNFSYKCFLMPEKCSEIFSSFGNETKARLQMKSHLVAHIAQLCEAKSLDDGDCGKHFFAEPLSVRRRRLQEVQPKKKKKGKLHSKKLRNSLSKKILDKRPICSKSKGIKDDLFEQKKSPIHKSSKAVSSQAAAANVFVAKAHTRLRKSIHSNSIKRRLEKENGFKKFPSSAENFYFALQKVSNSSHDVQDDINKIYNYSDLKIDNSLDIQKLGNTTVMEINSCNTGENVQAELRNKRDMCHKTSVLHSLWSLPHDHTYTSVNGRTYIGDASDASKNMNIRPHKDGRKASHSDISVHLIIPTEPFPFVYEPHLPHIAEIKEIGSISRRSHIKCSNTISSDKKNCSSVEDSVPLVNKHACFRKINRLIIPEEMEPDSEDDENVPVSFSANCIEGKLCDQGNEESSSEQPTTLFSEQNSSSESVHLGERKLALKCIRALRMKKKDERGPLICQICNGKSFTAQATLMYHYRSHAGIKPFACSVCDATFTRQHSLNYHMLIHNNKSRFICDECGRSFRHPSHYKEHLRRHTGETPYQCTDCSLRFKTRNTYKRHLKTRHGKILTARGIRILSMEEFDKVRTMPRRRASKPLLLASSEIQETQWSDLTFSPIPEALDK